MKEGGGMVEREEGEVRGRRRGGGGREREEEGEVTHECTQGHPAR